MYLVMPMPLAVCLVSMLVVVLPAGRLLLQHRRTWSGLTAALHVVDHRHHRFCISGFFVDIFDLHDLKRVRGKCQSVHTCRGRCRCGCQSVHRLLTCRYLVCVTTGTHCRLLALQQPEQRCTSTHGGHSRKFALLRSNIALVTSTTSVRTLHRACWAGWASEGARRDRMWAQWMDHDATGSGHRQEKVAFPPPCSSFTPCIPLKFVCLSSFGIYS